MKSKFSIVIASIGSNSLTSTLNSIYSSSILPDEVIIVIPVVNRLNVTELSIPGVKYFYVDFMGQVNQRVYGFGLIKYEFVIQLDDDIIVDKYCFENLINCYNNQNGKHIVGPAFLYNNGLSCYSNPPFFHRLLSALLLIKIKPGHVSPIGYGYGIDFSYINVDFSESEWLAGGCVLFHRSDLPNESHFPYSGKAYCEDLIFSAIMKKRNFNIYIARNAKCVIEKPQLNRNNYNLKNDYLARKYLLSICHVSSFKLEIWYFFKRIFYFFKNFLH